MPTLATGCCSARALRQAGQRGFTLIELLVVLAILGVLSVAVSLTLSTDGRRAANTDVQRLALLLETASLETQAGGRQLAWSTQDDGYAFWEMGDAREQRWQPLSNDELFRTRHLADGLHIKLVEIDGQALPDGALLIFRRGDPLLFRIVLALPGASAQSGMVELRGTASGRVEVAAPGTS